MKLLTKEEEQAHYKYVSYYRKVLCSIQKIDCLVSYLLRGGIGGGIVGTTIGALGVWGASARYPAFRKLTIPFRAFLIASSGSFTGTTHACCCSLPFSHSDHIQPSSVPIDGLVASRSHAIRIRSTQRPLSKRSKASSRKCKLTSRRLNAGSNGASRTSTVSSLAPGSSRLPPLWPLSAAIDI